MEINGMKFKLGGPSRYYDEYFIVIDSMDRLLVLRALKQKLIERNLTCVYISSNKELVLETIRNIEMLCGNLENKLRNLNVSETNIKRILECQSK